MLTKYACAVMLFLISAGTSPAAEKPDIVVCGCDRVLTEGEIACNVIYIADLTTCAVSSVFTDDGTGFSTFALDPSAERIAVVFALVRTVDSEPDILRKLLVMDTEGRVIKTIRDTTEGIAWSPDGAKLAYTKGFHVPYRGTDSEGTFILDMETGESRQVHDMGERLHWAKFDGRLYIRTGGYDRIRGHDPEKVLAYDPTSGEIGDTDYRDVYFSPDEEHYFATYDESTEISLMIRARGEDIAKRYAFLQSKFRRCTPNWLSSDVLIFNWAPNLNYLLFIETGRALKTQQPVLAVRGETAYLSKPGLKIEAVPLDSLEVVFSEEDGILKPEEQPATEQGAEHKQE